MDDKRAICQKLSFDRIENLCAAAPAEANRIALVFAAWVSSSGFNFDLCDPLANRLEAFINHCDFEAKSACLIATLELGTSHNRWYVEWKFMKLCGPSMEVNLADRLGIEFRILGKPLCKMISHIERSISVNRASLHSSLVRAIGEVCP